MATILESLINSWATLVIAGARKIEEVPEYFTLGGVSYPIKEMVIEEIEKRKENQ